MIRRSGRHRRGHATIFAMLTAIPLVCLAMLVGNSSDVLRRSQHNQLAADTAAVSGATVLARGLNRIQENNAEIGLALGVEVITRASSAALDDAARTAEACAPYSEVCASYLGWIASVGPVLQERWELQVQGAADAIAARADSNRAALEAFPAAAREVVRRVAGHGGADVTALIHFGDDGPEELPRYPAAMAPLSAICSVVRDGSPSGADPERRRVFAARWGWPTDVGTAEHARGELGVDPIFELLAPVGGPIHFANRLDGEIAAACSDGRTAPALFDGTLEPDVDRVLERLAFVVAVRSRHELPFTAPLFPDGGPAFRRRPDGLLAVAQVELINPVSIDGTTAAFAVRLALGTSAEAALEHLATGGADDDDALGRLADEALAWSRRTGIGSDH